MFKLIRVEYFSKLSGLSATLGWAVWVYQLPRELGSFRAFQWVGWFMYFSGLCVFGCSAANQYTGGYGWHTCIYFLSKFY